MTELLAGRTIIVTRPVHQAADLVSPLEARGARTFVLPAIGIEPTEDSAFCASMSRLADYDWVVLTSVNGVWATHRMLGELGVDWPAATRLGVIGPATAQAARAVLRQPDAMPDEYISDALADALGEVRGKRILLARANRARRDLAQILLARGARVEEVVAYRIVEPQLGTAEFPPSAPDAIALTSSAGVHGTLANLQAIGKEQWMRESALVCIGPITAATVRELGFPVAGVAESYDVPGLVEALVQCLGPAGVTR